jgi:hypothetical protein
VEGLKAKTQKAVGPEDFAEGHPERITGGNPPLTSANPASAGLLLDV